ncbi:hypothetical protein AYO49_04375 [Verrucomicrobiaceae bacterium SCGC AG-212-N21]|nr:hypothetical protein AYO49_04375 [Verrucomicrobiaceae bacterium SCGC AG-212-N21]
MIQMRLESCTDRAGWRLTQTGGPGLLPASIIFALRADAVDFARQRCEHSGCVMTLRDSKQDQASRS